MSSANVLAFNKVITPFQPIYLVYKEEKLKFEVLILFLPKGTILLPHGSRRPLHCATVLYVLWMEDILF